MVLWTGYVQRVTRRAMTATPTYTPGGTPSATHGTIATIALKAAPRMSWYRTARGGIYAFGLFVAAIAVFMGLRTFGIGPFGSLLASGRLNRRDSILLTDFRTTNVDSTLGRVVSDAVRAGLTGSSAFTLVQPAQIVSALRLMQRPPDTRVDSAVAREIAERSGIKAIVDGNVTGVPGGYIVSIRLVRTDSGGELASFRETGDGPRGLIDAADKLARELRSKAGESLRAVNATPSLAQATTSSLDALRKYSQAVRLNTLGEPRALARRARGRRARLDVRDRVEPSRRHARQLWRYAVRHRLGARRKRTASGIDCRRSSATWWPPATTRSAPVATARRPLPRYEAILQRGDTLPAVLINLGEQLRSRREFARAESLNLAAARIDPSTATPLGNAVELEIDQGKLKEAAATDARLADVSARYGSRARMAVAFAQGDDKTLRSIADSLSRAGGNARRIAGLPAEEAIALRDGRLHDFSTIGKERFADNLTGPEFAIRQIFFELADQGTVARNRRRGSTRPSRRCRSATCPWWTAHIWIWLRCSHGWVAPRRLAP